MIQLINAIQGNIIYIIKSSSAAPFPYYEDVILGEYSDGLVSYYPMNDVGFPLTDATANSYDSVATGSSITFNYSDHISNTSYETSVKFGGTSAQTYIQLETSGAAGTTRFRLTYFTLATWFKRTAQGNVSTTGTGTGGIIAEPLICKGAAESEAAGLNANFALGLEPLITGSITATTSDYYPSSDYEKATSGENGRMIYVSASVGADNFTTLTNTLANGGIPFNHNFSDGDRVRFGGTLPAGLTAATWYYVVGTTANSFQASTVLAGDAINITSAGTNPWCNHARGNTIISASDSTNWHFIASTWDGTYLRSYLDGVLAEEEAPAFAPPESASAQIAGIGAYITSGGTKTGALSGAMQHTTIWNRALTSADILNLYNTGSYVAPAVPVAPSIATQPLHEPTNYTSSAIFNVAVTGTPPYYFQWRRNTTNLVDSQYITGSNTSSMTINNVTESNGGYYDCYVTNSIGSIYTNRVVLSVYHAPDDDAHIVGDSGVAILGDRCGGYISANAVNVLASILADGDITNVVSTGDQGSSTEPYTLFDSFTGSIKTREGDFYPLMGNHDYDNTRESEIISYFTTSLGNSNNPGKYYYSKVLGNIEFFMIDDNPEEGAENANGINGTAAAFQASPMGVWMINKISSSTAPWKVVMIHHTVFSDSSTAASTANRWPFADLGVHCVVQGHAHGIERIYTGSIHYFTCAMGGANHHGWSTITPNTEFRVENQSVYGYLRFSDTPNKLILEFFDTGSNRLDRTVIVQ